MSSVAFGKEGSNKWAQTATASTQIKNFHWKMQPWLQYCALQNRTCRQHYVKKPPKFWKREKFQTSYTCLTISHVQPLDHAGVSNSCFFLAYYKFTEALQTGNKTCCSVQNDSGGCVWFSKQSLNGFHLGLNKNNLHWLWQGLQL